jgi:hypothetical protein
MKKSKKALLLTGAFLALFLAAGAGSAFAQPMPLSIGGGLILGTESLILDWPDGSSGIAGGGINFNNDNRINMRQNSVGASIFFDAHFVTLSLDFLQGNFDVSGRMPNVSGSPHDPPEMFVGSWSATLINANLIGKFPIAFFGMDTARVFPMIGLGYQLGNVVEELDGGMFDRSFNNVRVLFGLGGDFDLNNRVFFRVSVLPYYHLTRDFTLMLVDPSTPVGDTSMVAHGGFGLNAGLTVGFRLGSNPQPMPPANQNN